MTRVRTLLAVALLSGVALAMSAADVSGTWDLEMKWSGNARSTGVCTFKQEGEKLTGTCGSPEKFPITGRVQDRQLSWQFDVSQEGNIGRMKFDGDLDEQGTTIEGSCSVVDGQDGTFTMKRQKS
jgi:hypothetical protein